jgi:hypothetical protein
VLEPATSSDRIACSCWRRRQSAHDRGATSRRHAADLRRPRAGRVAPALLGETSFTCYPTPLLRTVTLSDSSSIWISSAVPSASRAEPRPAPARETPTATECPFPKYAAVRQELRDTYIRSCPEADAAAPTHSAARHPRPRSPFARSNTVFYVVSGPPLAQRTHFRLPSRARFERRPRCRSGSFGVDEFQNK